MLPPFDPKGDMDLPDADDHQTPEPFRLVLTFKCIDEKDGIVDNLIGELIDMAESHGLFYEGGARISIDIEDIVEGSRFHQALTGIIPR